MTYENGKWTMYTSDNTKFEMTEDQFREIFSNFSELADQGNQIWFNKILGKKLPWQYRETNTYFSPDEHVHHQVVYDAVEEAVDKIEQDYYLVSVTDIKDRF